MIGPDEFDLCKKFQVPPDYNPPQTYEEQRVCTQYPNVNTFQYRQKPVEHETKLWPFIQCFARNSEGTVILGTNSYQTRIWNGSLYAFDDVVEDQPQFETRESVFKARTETPVSVLKFIDDTMFMMGDTDGCLTLFSTKSVMRETDQSKYCLFSIGRKTEHKSLVSCLDIFREKRQKAVSGDSDGCLLTWDLASSDLNSIDTIRFAHCDAINAVATALDNDDCFVTASDDKNLLHWDMRDPRPSSALLESHAFQLKAVEYLNENQVLVGDRAGIVYVIDTKMPKEIVFQQEILYRPIHQFFVNGQNVIMLGDSNHLHVQQFNGTEMISLLDVIEAPNFLRAAAWINESEFYVAGWSSYVQKYKI